MFTSKITNTDPSIRTFQDNDLVFMEGDDSREMYVVIEGEIAVTKKTAAGGSAALATLQRGDFLGEMSLLESLPRSATARAKGHTKLLAIQPGGFLLKIRRDPTFAFEMLQSLSKRIRMTNDSLMRELDRSGSNAESLRAILQGAEFQNHELTRIPDESLIDSISTSISTSISGAVTGAVSDVTKVVDDVLGKVK